MIASGIHAKIQTCFLGLLAKPFSGLKMRWTESRPVNAAFGRRTNLSQCIEMGLETFCIDADVLVYIHNWG
jgi:hypothetical protein